MTRILKPTVTLLAAGIGLAATSACSSMAPTNIPPSYLQGTALDRNAISVEKKTEFLEVAIHPEASEISLADKAAISGFVAAYRDHGHGPLVMSLPESSANPQLAVAAVAEARAIAYENGVQYEEIEGTHHGENSMVSEPMILAFQAYEAIAPDCPSLAEINVADISTNNESSTLGCAVRSNLAAMIADPADLLGARTLDKGDPIRRSVILEKFRQGEATGSTRTSQESGTVSQAISN